LYTGELSIADILSLESKACVTPRVFRRLRDMLLWKTLRTIRRPSVAAATEG
jgi:hypothetical protein